MGAGDPPSKILIDGVPVEGVEEFIYLGSKQSSNGYCRPDVLRRIGLACSVMNSLQRELQFSQYEHQSTPLPSADKVCSVLSVHSDYATTTMMMKDMRLASKMEGKTNFQGTYRLS